MLWNIKFVTFIDNNKIHMVCLQKEFHSGGLCAHRMFNYLFQIVCSKLPKFWKI